MMPAVKAARTPSDTTFFVPDLCGRSAVLTLVVLLELFAVILALAGTGLSEAFWVRFAVVSLFMQWSGLVGAGLLCLGRGQLLRLGDITGGLIAWGMLVAVVAFTSAVTVQLAPLVLLDPPAVDFIPRNTTIGAIVAALLLRYFYVVRQWQRRVKAEAEARLQALSARIRPHFLFNSMNTIAALTRSNPELAERVVEDLADLFRASLAADRSLIPLAEELALTERYLEIEQLRLGPRLRVVWQLEEGVGQVQLPPLTLQPLVENAVYHGIEPQTDGGEVVVAVRSTRGGVRLVVDNPLPPPAVPRRSGHRMALANVRDRLEAAFPEVGELLVRQTSDRFHVELFIPTQEGVQ